MPTINRITDWPASSIDRLIIESSSEGYRFLVRLQDEWLSGANRFEADGEALFGVWEGEELIAGGGINKVGERCGRLRRVYVGKRYRRRGIGSLLVQHLIAFSDSRHSTLILRTDSEAADRFYRSNGFRTVAREDVTHELNTKAAQPGATDNPDGA